MWRLYAPGPEGLSSYAGLLAMGAVAGELHLMRVPRARRRRPTVVFARAAHVGWRNVIDPPLPLYRDRPPPHGWGNALALNTKAHREKTSTKVPPHKCAPP